MVLSIAFNAWAGTNTTNLQLYKPAQGEVNWATSVNNNFNTLDTAVGTKLNANGTFKTGAIGLSDLPAGGATMPYPSSGIPTSTGAAWGTSIVDNSTAWNTVGNKGNLAGGNTWEGDQTVNGTFTSTGFVGSGAGLTGLAATHAHTVNIPWTLEIPSPTPTTSARNQVWDMKDYNGELYIAYAGNYNSTSKAEIMKWDGVNLTLVKNFNTGTPANGIYSIERYNGKLYAGSVEPNAPYANIYVQNASVANFIPFDNVQQRGSTATYSNKTVEAITPGGTPFIIKGSSGTANASMYFGLNNTFGSFNVYLNSTATNYTPSLTYWNGSAWNATSITSDTTNNLTQNGVIGFTVPGDWAITTVNSVSDLYWLRMLSSTSSTDATAYMITQSPSDWEISFDSSKMSDGNTYNAVHRLITFDNNLYAGMGYGIGDGDIWKFNGTTWAQVYNDTTANNVNDFKVIQGRLYCTEGGASDGHGQVVSSADGTNWTVDFQGSDFAGNYSECSGIDEYRGKTYTSTYGHSGPGTGDVLVKNGTNWDMSLDNTVNTEVDGMCTYSDMLYATAGKGNSTTARNEIYVYDGNRWSTSRAADLATQRFFTLRPFGGSLFAGGGDGANLANIYRLTDSPGNQVARSLKVISGFHLSDYNEEGNTLIVETPTQFNHGLTADYFMGNGSLLTGLPTTANTTKEDNGQTAYGWGNHASAGYTNLSTVLALSNLTNYYNKTVADARYGLLTANNTWTGIQTYTGNGTSLFPDIHVTNNATIDGTAKVGSLEVQGTGAGGGKYFDAAGTNYVEVKAPTSVTATYTMYYPTAAPTANGQVMTHNTNGTTSFANQTGGANPAGTGTEMQYRVNSTALGGATNTTWNTTEESLLVPQLKASSLLYADSDMSHTYNVTGKNSNLTYGVTINLPAANCTLAQRATAGEYNTTQVTEGTNLYYTNARANSGFSITLPDSSTWEGGHLSVFYPYSYTYALTNITGITNATGSNLNVTVSKSNAWNDRTNPGNVTTILLNAWTNGTLCSYNTNSTPANTSIEAGTMIMFHYNSGTNSTLRLLFK
jgi:hypothetical protein